MSGATHPAPITSEEGTTLALTTNFATLAFLPSTHQVKLLAPSEDWRFHFIPAIKDIVIFDASRSANDRFHRPSSDSALSLRQALTDRKSGTGSGTGLDSFTSSDFLYICLADLAAGIHINIKAASPNGTNNTMTGAYWDGSAWTSLSVTDGTDTGASLAQDGDVTWTAVTNWKRQTLGGPQGIVDNANVLTVKPGQGGYNDISTEGYWLRLSWDNGLDSDTEIEEINALHNDTAYGFYSGGTEYIASIDPAVIGGIQALVTANTDTLQVTEYKVTR